MIPGHARRHKQPRYMPLGPRRGPASPDPARVEHTHPSWCNCPRCTPRSPADRGRLGCAALTGFLGSFALGLGGAAIGVGIVWLYAGREGIALIFGAVL